MDDADPAQEERRKMEMNSVTFHVPGKPQGKARAKTVHNKNIGHSVSYTPEKDLLYENLIKAMYINAAKGTKFDKEIPVALRIAHQRRKHSRCWQANFMS